MLLVGGELCRARLMYFHLLPVAETAVPRGNQ